MNKKEYKKLIKEAKAMDAKCKKYDNTYNFPSPGEIEPIIDRIEIMMSDVKEFLGDDSPEYNELFELEDILCDHFREAHEY